MRIDRSYLLNIESGSCVMRNYGGKKFFWRIHK